MAETEIGNLERAINQLAREWRDTHESEDTSAIITQYQALVLQWLVLMPGENLTVESELPDEYLPEAYLLR